MKILVFLGTVRNSTPPKPARLGERVAKACIKCLNEFYREHQIELVDALDYPLDSVFKPQFAYVKGQAPTALNTLADKIQMSDAFVMVSPEYNHSMSPALAHLLNHFGSSLFSYKPSVIVTYSAGQWGGMRAAVNMRTFLSELGCLSVSAMIHVPKAQLVFTEQGTMQQGEEESAWFDYFNRAFNQLVWWAEATKQHKERVDPNVLLGRFNATPAERNAP